MKKANGVMEWWSIGVLLDDFDSEVSTPSPHRSTTPPLRSSPARLIKIWSKPATEDGRITRQLNAVSRLLAAV